MNESYINPEDVSPQDVRKVLDFLNAAKSAEEIAEAVEIPDERDVGNIVGQHILDRRDELGEFTNLQQVADVRQVGPERFTEIVTTLRGPKMGGDAMDDVNAVDRNKSYVVNSYSYRLIFTDGPEVGSMRLETDQPHVYINFVSDHPSLHASSETANSVNMYHHQTALPLLVDMLRNEKPVYVQVIGSPGDPGIMVSTFFEPTGEGEISQTP